jgi:electron transfer flavoprotein alpha subunit
MTGILIAGELAGGRPSPVTGQLLAAAARGFPGVAVSVAFLSDGFETAAESAFRALPASAVYTVEHQLLGEASTGGYEAQVDALAALCAAIKPDAVLFAKTDFGANAGPSLGPRLGGIVAQDCTGLAAGETPGSVIITRPVYGGSAVAEYEMSGPTLKVIIIRPGAFGPASLDGGSAETVRFDVSAAIRAPKVRLISAVREAQPGIRLEDARVVVSGGRGLGGPAPFSQLRELAGLLGGAVGASRAACDAGWIDHSHQVGLTGKTVNPALYIAIAISGASQHMAGCSGSGTIVAINKDREANIFKEARFGIVGDWQKALPAFIATVRDLGKS